MGHRFTVIFEKEAEGGYHVFCPHFPAATHRAKPLKRVSRTSAKRLSFTLKRSSKMASPFPPPIDPSHLKGVLSRSHIGN